MLSFRRLLRGYIAPMDFGQCFSHRYNGLFAIGFQDRAVAANANYTVTDGFIVRPEVSWHRTTGGVSEWGGMVRFQRSY